MTDPERVLVATGTTDAGSVSGVLWPAFVRETGTNATLDYVQDVSTPRVLATLRDAPEGSRPSVVFVSNPAALVRADLSEPLGDAAASEGFPDGWLDPDGRWMPLYVQPVVCVHNGHHGPPPRRWDDLLSDRYVDRICFEEPWRMLTTGPGLAELGSTMGERAWTDFVRGLVAQAPRIVGDNERSVLEVATGARWVGLSNWNVARRVRAGSPVRHLFFDPTPCIPGFGVLVRGGRDPDLGRRFLAWLRSADGQRAYSQTGRVPALLGLDVPTALERVLPRGVSPLCGTTSWVSRPEPWVERFRDLFGAAVGTVRQGKFAPA